MIHQLIHRLTLRPLLFVLGLFMLVLSAVAARSAGSSSGPGWSYDAIAKVPEKARVRHNSFEGDAQAMTAGRKLYSQHCAECHGAAGEGGRKGPSLRADEVRNATPGTLFWVLSNGVVRRGMPVWSKLPEPERWEIVSFLKSLPPEAGEEPRKNRGQAGSARRNNW